MRAGNTSHHMQMAPRGSSDHLTRAACCWLDPTHDSVPTLHLIPSTFSHTCNPHDGPAAWLVVHYPPGGYSYWCPSCFRESQSTLPLTHPYSSHPQCAVIYPELSAMRGRRHRSLIGRVGIAVFVQEQLHHRGMALARCAVQGCVFLLQKGSSVAYRTRHIHGWLKAARCEGQDGVRAELATVTVVSELGVGRPHPARSQEGRAGG